MRAKHEGTIERRGGRPYAVLLSVPGQPRRTRLRLPKGCSEAFAEEKRAVWSTLAASGQLVPATPEASALEGEAFAGWADRWLDHRAARGIGTVADNRSRLKQHVTPLLGGKAMSGITADDLEAVRDALDARIRGGSLSAGTARNVWCNVTSMFRDACRSKTRELRVRADNPATDIEGPDGGDEKPGPFLYPSEFLQLMRCAAVPLAWRQLIAVAVYLGQRASELRALLPSDVDLAHHQVAVTKKRRKKGGPTEPPKTRTPAFPDIEPTLEPLLRHLVDHPAGEGGHLVWTAQGTLASTFRSQLRRAGLTRTELLDETPATRAITFHDLRHTCATWMSLRGQSAWAIMGRTGHKNLSTVQRYVDQGARKNAAQFGEVFPPLPPELWGDLSTPSVHGPGYGDSGSPKDETKCISSRLLGFHCRHSPARGQKAWTDRPRVRGAAGGTPRRTAPRFCGRLGRRSAARSTGSCARSGP